MTNLSTVPALILTTQITQQYRRLLEIIITVSLATREHGGRMTSCTIPTHSGTASSVKVSAAAMENLPHGSVWSYQTQRLTILRCVFAHWSALIRMLSFNCWRYTSSNSWSLIRIS